MGYDIKGTVSIPAEAWIEFANNFAPSQSASNAYSNPRIQSGELVFDYQASTDGVTTLVDHGPVMFRVSDMDLAVRRELATLTNRLQSFLESLMTGHEDPNIITIKDYADEVKLMAAFDKVDPLVTRDEVNDMVCFAVNLTNISPTACEAWLDSHPE